MELDTDTKLFIATGLFVAGLTYSVISLVKATKRNKAADIRYRQLTEQVALDNMSAYEETLTENSTPEEFAHHQELIAIYMNA